MTLLMIIKDTVATLSTPVHDSVRTLCVSVCVGCSDTSRTVASGTLDCVATAGSANAVANSNLPSSVSYAVQVTKPSPCVMHVIGPVDMSAPVTSECRALIRDDSRQLTAAQSLLTLSQHVVQPSKSADRLTSTDNHFNTRQPLTPHRNNSVQRSHSFTTTSHQPPANVGLSDCCYSCC